MNYIYAIKSQKRNNIYVGMTDNIERRLKEHNSGKVKSTKAYKPYKLIYREEVKGNKTRARQREKYFKSGCGKEFLKNIIIN